MQERNYHIVILNQSKEETSLLCAMNILLKMLIRYACMLYFRDTYFIMGEPNEKKTDQDTLQGLTPDPRYISTLQLYYCTSLHIHFHAICLFQCSCFLKLEVTLIFDIKQHFVFNGSLLPELSQILYAYSGAQIF